VLNPPLYANRITNPLELELESGSCRIFRFSDFPFSAHSHCIPTATAIPQRPPPPPRHIPHARRVLLSWSCLSLFVASRFAALVLLLCVLFSALLALGMGSLGSLSLVFSCPPAASRAGGTSRFLSKAEGALLVSVFFFLVLLLFCLFFAAFPVCWLRLYVTNPPFGRMVGAFGLI
jgi:hypothetical protein